MRMTLTQRIAALNAEGRALLDTADNRPRFAELRRELEELQVRLEAQRRRKAEHKRKLRAVRPARTMEQELERFRKAVVTRTGKLAATPEGSQEWHRTRRGLELAERTLAKFESYAALLAG